MSVTADISLSIEAYLAGSPDLGSARQRVTISENLQFEPGTASIGQANILFADTRTLAASATENLDLAGVLTNAFGAVITAAEIVAIFVRAAAGNTNAVLIGPGASNGFLGPWNAATDRLRVLPGEWHMLTCQAGWGVTAGTGDILFAGNGGAGTAVTYDLVLIGRTVAA